VRVKTYPEILATLDVNNKTRGLSFDAPTALRRWRTDFQAAACP